MKYDELKRNIGKAGLTIKEFSELIKVNSNSITNLSTKKEVPKHLAIIAVLLGELADNGIDYKYLFDKIDIEPQKARHSGSFFAISKE